MRQQAKATPEQVRIRPLDGRIPFGNGIVAIVNKHARQIREMLAHDIDHDPCACLNHPMHQQTRAAQQDRPGKSSLTIVAAREALARGKQDNTITSSGPEAQGRSIMYPGLIGSLPRNC